MQFPFRFFQRQIAKSVFLLIYKACTERWHRDFFIKVAQKPLLPQCTGGFAPLAPRPRFPLSRDAGGATPQAFIKPHAYERIPDTARRWMLFVSCAPRSGPERARHTSFPLAELAAKPQSVRRSPGQSKPRAERVVCTRPNRAQYRLAS